MSTETLTPQAQAEKVSVQTLYLAMASHVRKRDRLAAERAEKIAAIDAEFGPKIEASHDAAYELGSQLRELVLANWETLAPGKKSLRIGNSGTIKRVLGQKSLEFKKGITADKIIKKLESLGTRGLVVVKKTVDRVALKKRHKMLKELDGLVYLSQSEKLHMTIAGTGTHLEFDVKSARGELKAD